MNPRSDYKFHTTNDMLLIIDLNLGNKSVTNDMERVLADIAARGFDLNTKYIIARDSEGIYDRVLFKDNRVDWAPVLASDLIRRIFSLE